MTPAIYINPDTYLETAAGRVFTVERNEAAWARALARLSAAMTDKLAPECLYVVVGVQGAGKTTWVRANESSLAGSVVLDAALPTKTRQSKILAIAKEANCPATAIWVDVPLELALARNRLRPLDQQVPEAAVRSVFAKFERPSAEEGFTRVVVVNAA